jgi:hypothetical protein
MISKTIAQRVNKSQDRVFNSKEGESVTGNIFKKFISNLIREHAIHKNDGYQLTVDDLPYQEKKHFLSHLVDIDDYEYFIKNKTRELEAIKDYKDEMQYFINCNIDEIYHEDMQEMGMVLCHHRDNGEFYYRS